MVVAALAVAAPPAMAQGEDTVTLEKGGATKLSLNKKTKGKLRKAGVTLSGKSFAITGGTIDPVDADPADIDHAGRLTVRFNDEAAAKARKAHVEKVTLKNLNILLGSNDALAAKIGGKTVTIAKLSGGTVARQGVESTDVNGITAKLTRAGAKALNKALGTKAFKRGMKLGKLSIDAQLAEALIAATGMSELQISLSAAQKLQSQGISASAISPATQHAGTGGLPKFAFPISGGLAKTDLSEFSVFHTGGLLLKKGSTEIPLLEPGIEVKTPPVLTVSIGGPSRLASGDLDLSAATKTPTATGFDYAGIVVKLNAAAAQILNASFNTTVFAAGDVVGTASGSATFK